MMTPASTVRPALPRLSIEELPSCRVPLPAFVRPVPDVMSVVRMPLKVVVSPAVAKVILSANEPRWIEPAKVSAALPLPPIVKSPVTSTALCSVRAALSANSEVPAAMVSVPVPRGPLVGVRLSELSPIIRLPASRLTPVVKVLSALVSARVPSPAFFSGPVMPALSTMRTATLRPTTPAPASTVMIGLALENSSDVRALEPVRMVGTVDSDSFLELMALAEVRMKRLTKPVPVGVPRLNSGFTVPPSFSKVMLVRDWVRSAPTREA